MKKVFIGNSDVNNIYFPLTNCKFSKGCPVEKNISSKPGQENILNRIKE
jgi:hypothetical protein